MPDVPALHRIKALFEDPESLERALGSLKASGAQDYEAYGPTNLAYMSELMPGKRSFVRPVATVNAIIGLVLFFYMCVATSLIFKLITGGKPPWSNVPFVIPTYEGTILFGAIGAFLAALFFAKIFTLKTPPEYDRRFTSSNWGVNVYTTSEKIGSIVEILKNAGAVEIDESTE